VLTASINRTLLRPRALFTQGLFFEGDTLYESSGLYSLSELNSYSLSDNRLKPIKGLKFPDSYFAEGATMAGGLIQVLTWREGTLFRVDPASLSIKESVFYQGEGWGLTTDGKRLFVSDGTDALHVRNPLTFEEILPPILARDGEKPITGLNELEWDPATGLILANVYQTDLVAAIDPDTGQAAYFLDLSPLRAQALREAAASRRPARPDVTNGLAIGPQGRLFATGKFWGLLFEIGPPPAPAGRGVPGD
jgi:glutamine cyclotransferase